MTNREEIARSGIEEGLQNVREYFAKIKKNCYMNFEEDCKIDLSSWMIHKL